jgi:hypothetical protein
VRSCGWGNCCCIDESSCFVVQLKMGGMFHLKLNISESPIAYKYRKGKMQRTLKRESKELEIVKRETIKVSYSTILCEIQLINED